MIIRHSRGRSSGNNGDGDLQSSHNDNQSSVPQRASSRGRRQQGHDNGHDNGQQQHHQRNSSIRKPQRRQHHADSQKDEYAVGKDGDYPESGNAAAAANVLQQQLGVEKQQRVANTAALHALEVQAMQAKVQAMQAKKDNARQRLTTAGNTIVATNRFGSVNFSQDHQQHGGNGSDVPELGALSIPGRDAVSLQQKAQLLAQKKRSGSPARDRGSPGRGRGSPGRDRDSPDRDRGRYNDFEGDYDGGSDYSQSARRNTGQSPRRTAMSNSPTRSSSSAYGVGSPQRTTTSGTLPYQSKLGMSRA